jgi:hypothetical protein
MAIFPTGWASCHSPFDWECALGLLRAPGELSHEGESPRTLDKQARVVAVVAAEGCALMGTMSDYYWLAETRREQAISIRLHCEHTFVSLPLDLPFTASILFCITNWANTTRWS